MASAYPGALDTLATNKADATSTATDHAAHHNDLADAVNKVEAELGTDPSAAFATVKARLAAMPQFVALASDATAVVGTAYADAAAGLDIALTSGVPCRFQYMIAWQPNAATTGARFSLNGPAFTYLVYSVRWSTTATVVTQSPLGTAYDQAFTVGTASNNSAQNLAIIEGLIVPSASANLRLRSGAEVASPGSVTVKAGSSLLYW
jgi:hypothetical protein